MFKKPAVFNPVFFAVALSALIATGAGVYYFWQLRSSQEVSRETAKRQIEEDLAEESRKSLGGTDMAAYKNPEWGFEIRYPRDYEIEKYDFDLVFLSPEVRQCVKDKGNIDDCKNNSPRVGYYFNDMYFNNLSFEQWVAQRKQEGAIPRDSSVEEITVNGIKGYEVGKKGINGLHRDIYFFRGDNLIINFDIPKDAPAKEMETFNRILNTLSYAEQTKEIKGGTEAAAGWQTYRNKEWGFEIQYPADYKTEFYDFNVVFLSPDARKCLDGGGTKEACEFNSPHLGHYYQDYYFNNLTFEQWIDKKRQDNVLPEEAALHNITVGGQKAYEIGMKGPEGKRFLNIFILRENNKLINLNIARESKELKIFDQIVDTIKFID